MTCSKPRCVFRPVLENLESRLQPGSVVTGQGYGWSLLADNLSILEQGSSHRLISQSSSESAKPALTSIPVDLHSDHQGIAVAKVMAARTDSLPTNKLLDNLADGLTNDDFGLLSLT